VVPGHGFVLSNGVYATIDFPGADYTEAIDVNDAGDIVGSYNFSDGNSHGFVLSRGVYTTLDVPGSSYTKLYGINNARQAVGVYGKGTPPLTSLNSKLFW
jgi:predicted transcriptional regulator